ncbi:peptidoglycan bridge formation glycyltransferase FemA/FemB family protein [Lactococcus insecticola]|uniref:Peptidoglycan branched peptide synthesis protein n=1 Tax=Pseudolactococcus insecticola TaxID=2709158 RepID=A0A6A0B619_9LACT|nr:peptidoglycan bridge formation glycyltransferase FemA/FemB family protein [Lactococcus insecticola]GFH39734.1 peptidoglycan branched peptide synthesis protein [Lactococcus insecticola]
MQSKKFTALKADEFGDFVATREQVHFQQTREFGDVQEGIGHKIAYFGVKVAGDVQAAMLVSLSKVRFGYLAEAHGNPYFSEDKPVNQMLMSGIKDALKQQGVIKFIIHSNQKIATYDDKWEKTADLNTDLTAFYANLGLSETILSEFEKGYAFNYSKDLTGFDSFSKLQKSYKKNGLQTVKKAEKLDIKITEASFEDLANFKKVVDEAGERRNFSTRDLAYYETVFKAYKDKVKFVFATINFQKEYDVSQKKVAELESQILQLDRELAESDSLKKKKSIENAYQMLRRERKLDKEIAKSAGIYGDKDVILSAAQFFIMPAEILYMFSGMYDEFREFSAPFLIQDYMLKYAYDHKISSYNFMGINAQSNPDQGVLRFKQNFTGYIWQSSGNYELVIRPVVSKITAFLKKIIGR